MGFNDKVRELMKGAGINQKNFQDNQEFLKHHLVDIYLVL